MSDDVWDNDSVTPQPTVSPTALTIDQLTKLQASKSSAHIEIELCYSKKKAYVKPLKVNDKKELLKAVESKNEVLVNRVFDNILQKYVDFDDPNMTYENIILQERYQILTYIRTANGDKTATIAHQCAECEKVTKDIVYDLDDLHLKEYKGSPSEEIVTIPLDGNDKINIHIKPLTRLDEKSAERYCKQEGLETMSEKGMVYIAASINKITAVVGGVAQNVQFKDFSEKVDYYKGLPGKIDDQIKEIIRVKFDFGVKMPLDFKCKHCGYHDKNDEVNVAVFFIS